MRMLLRASRNGSKTAQACQHIHTSMLQQAYSRSCCKGSSRVLAQRAQLSQDSKAQASTSINSDSCSAQSNRSDACCMHSQRGAPRAPEAALPLARRHRREPASSTRIRMRVTAFTAKRPLASTLAPVQELQVAVAEPSLVRSSIFIGKGYDCTRQGMLTVGGCAHHSMLAALLWVARALQNMLTQESGMTEAA